MASGRPRNPSLPPSSMITIAGLWSLEHARQAGESTLRGFAADAGVDHLVSVPFGGEPLRKQVYPAFLNLDAVSGAETVAQHDDGAGRGGFGSGWVDQREDQHQLNEPDERTQSRKPHKKGYQPRRDADHRERCFVGHRGGRISCHRRRIRRGQIHAAGAAGGPRFADFRTHNPRGRRLDGARRRWARAPARRARRLRVPVLPPGALAHGARKRDAAARARGPARRARRGGGNAGARRASNIARATTRASSRAASSSAWRSRAPS